MYICIEMGGSPPGPRGGVGGHHGVGAPPQTPRRGPLAPWQLVTRVWYTRTKYFVPSVLLLIT